MILQAAPLEIASQPVAVAVKALLPLPEMAMLSGPIAVSAELKIRKVAPLVLPGEALNSCKLLGLMTNWPGFWTCALRRTDSGSWSAIRSTVPCQVPVALGSKVT